MAGRHLAYIERRMAEGCENAMALWREVREQGFAGTHRQVHRFVAERRTMPAPRTAHQWRAKAGLAAAAEGKAAPLLSPKQLTWLLVQPMVALSASGAAMMARVEQES
jgi:hypothetical protein